mgnify:CR=1 FL=1
MERRSFLTGGGALALGGLLTGCNRQDQAALTIRLLKNSVPAQLVGAFEKSLRGQQVNLDFKPEPQLQTLFTLLQTWKQPRQPSPQRFPIEIPFLSQPSTANPADLVTLGDYWLATAIQQKLIQPLESGLWQQWPQVPAKWQAIVTRNQGGLPDPKGRVWAAPYRWGSTVILYRTDLFREKNLQPPTDWSDLWRDDLRGHISLLDQPREVIGLTLKRLDKSYNTIDLKTAPSLETDLRSLHQQVKFYSSDNYLQPLLLGDTWVAVGWSTDALPLMQRNQPIGAVFPRSGTALWSDLWVQPIASQTAPATQALLSQWINFCWTPEIAPQLSLLSDAASPILTALDAATFPKELQKNPLLLPSQSLLDRSEFLEPLPKSTVESYQSLWAKVRQAG